MEDYVSEVISFYLTKEWWQAKKSTRESIKKRLVELALSSSSEDGVIKSVLYTSLRHDSDIIFWIMARDPDTVMHAKLAIEWLLSGFVVPSHGFISIYKLTHAHKELDNAKYFVAYPMSKSSEWYLIDEEERKRIIAEHVKMAMESKHNKGIVSYTTQSFGISDHEFVVLYELNNIPEWVSVTEELRHARARKWITSETPILLGIKGIEKL